MGGVPSLLFILLSFKHHPHLILILSYVSSFLHVYIPKKLSLLPILSGFSSCFCHFFVGFLHVFSWSTLNFISKLIERAPNCHIVGDIHWSVGKQLRCEIGRCEMYILGVASSIAWPCCLIYCLMIAEVWFGGRCEGVGVVLSSSVERHINRCWSSAAPEATLGTHAPFGAGMLWEEVLFVVVEGIWFRFDTQERQSCFWLARE